MRYVLSDFESYLEKNTISQLPNESLAIIETLVKQVGAPEYIKTPQFKHGFNNFQKKKKKNNDSMNDNEWDSIRNFQATEFTKREGLDINLYQIRKLLNMLTNKNYNNILDEISNQFDIVISTKTPNDILVLCNLFYDITSSNLLYSNLSAKLYKDMLYKSKNLENLLNNNFSNAVKKLNQIIYVDPEINYDKFCENNKNNEKIRSEFTFFTNLMKYDIIKSDKIYNIIKELFSILDNFIVEENKKNEIDELSEIIYIVISNSYQTIKTLDIENDNLIINKIEKYTTLNIKNTPGITNKCIFKHMDLLDEIL